MYIFVQIFIMIKKILFIAFLFITSISFSQVKDSLDIKEIEKNDTLIDKTVLLQEVVVSRQKLDPEAKKQFLLLQNRVLKVYPFAKLAGDRLSVIRKTLDKLDSNKDKKKYFKIVENFMENEFKAKLKKLSRKQGQILVKLIHRQTGITTFDLIKDYKSGWKAFWSNSAAKMFDINLKQQYLPFDDNEDYFIETILYRFFVNGNLVETKGANPADIDELNESWEKKYKELSKTSK